MKKNLTSVVLLCVVLSGFRQVANPFATTEPMNSFYPIWYKKEQPRTGSVRRITKFDWSKAQSKNEPPKIEIDISPGNKTFFFPNKPIQYAVNVVDLEDGSLADGRISPDRVTVQIDYFSTRFDSTTTSLPTLATDESLTHATAQKLIFESDCRACHTVNKVSVGPTYARIAHKYKGDPDAVNRLARKVITGGKGVWGEATMSPHPLLSLTDASAIVTYILSLSETRNPATPLPVSGAYTPIILAGQSADGYFRLWASYTDRGTQSAGPVRSEQVKIFRSPVLLPEEATWRNNVQLVSAQPNSFYVVGPSSYVGYAQLDMTDISQVAVRAAILNKTAVLGGTIEVRSGSVTGKLIGRTTFDRNRLIALTDSGIAKTDDILIDLLPTRGINDVYFILTNPDASSQQALIQIDAFIVKTTPKEGDK